MQTKPQIETPDGTALALMLTYVEAECRRLGAEAAARYAAMAAAMLAPSAGGGSPPLH